MDGEVHGHVVEECKKLIVEMCGGVFMQPVHGTFNSLFIQSISKPGTIYMVAIERYKKEQKGNTTSTSETHKNDTKHIHKNT